MGGPGPGGAPGAGGAGGGGPGGQGGQGGPSEEEKKREAEDQRRMVLNQVMDAEARERLSRVAVVKPGVARGIEDQLIAMARGGRLRAKITEQQVKDLLNQASSEPETKITIQRKRRAADSDESDSDWEI